MSWLNDIKLLLKDKENRKSLGDDTTSFNITKDGDIITYTYDTGTKPDFKDIMAGMRLCIHGENFNSANNSPRALVSEITLEYFKIENASGIAESGVTTILLSPQFS